MCYKFGPVQRDISGVSHEGGVAVLYEVPHCCQEAVTVPDRGVGEVREQRERGRGGVGEPGESQPRNDRVPRFESRTSMQRTTGSLVGQGPKQQLCAEIACKDSAPSLCIFVNSAMRPFLEGDSTNTPH